jgi:iron complex transport system ATP-binding protein
LDTAKINEALELTQISHLATKKHYELVMAKGINCNRALAQDTRSLFLMNPLLT